MRCRLTGFDHRLNQQRQRAAEHQELATAQSHNPLRPGSVLTFLIDSYTTPGDTTLPAISERHF